MANWQDIETAPKDGTVVWAKRVHEGNLIFEGPAVWRTVDFPALPPHPLDGDVYAPAETATGWMMPGQEKRVPTPTHWAPDKTP